MRISSTTFYTASLAGMQQQQSSIAHLNMQLAANKRVLAPHEDPIAARRIMELTDRIALRNQHISNQQQADLALRYEQTVLTEMHKALDDANALLSGINASNSADLRQQIAQTLSGYYTHLKDLANTRDPSGNYIFGGYKTNAASLAPGSAPFEHTQEYPLDGDTGTPALTSGLTTYFGTPYPNGVREIEIDTGRKLQVSDNIAQVLIFDADGDTTIDASEDLLRAIDQAAIDLAQPTVTDAQIQTAVDAIKSALDKLGLIERRIAGAQIELEDVKKTTLALRLEEENAYGELQELDQAATIVELQQRETTLQASMQAFAAVSGLSLFNYL
jgi:flagellar hook-associated protein 3 FlgL